MQKRFWAIIIKQTILSLVIVFLAGVIFDRIFAEPYYRNPGGAGLVALGLYLAALAILGMLNLITGAIYLWLFAGRDLADAALDELRNLKLPAPRSYDPKTYDYLAILADDEGADPNDRVKAAVMVGAYSVHMSKGIFRGLAIRKAMDEAVLRYSQEAPQRRDEA
ncbi:MAG: hypothetical protein QOH47_1997 [Sphingomonadales bacterium]|jgi:hypothetical protein|nr:hypothetical protein [Sphingomonadales bacterium]